MKNVFNIIILSSCHAEIGKCNSMELFNIINIISPDIIFEELDTQSFNDHYGHDGPYSTETKAIYKYLFEHRINHIPVDTFDVNITKEEKAYMDNTIYNSSIEYKKLLEMQLNFLYNDGYKFLNSEECSELILKLQEQENIMQRQINDIRLRDIYKKWIKINNKREYEMIYNIYKYCKNNQFKKGLLITGAEHRNSLYNKLKEYKDENIVIDWSYWKYEYKT
jgi:hypothetical protein